MDFLNSFSRIGRCIPLWTQGQGSNLSEKVGTTLWIKPSGFRLDDVMSSEDLAQVDMPVLRAILDQIENDIPFHEFSQARGKISDHHEKIYAEALKKMSLRNGQIRPSMETAFHIFFPEKFIFHFHSLAGVLMAELLAQKDISFLNWLSANTASDRIDWVPYMRPGLDLAFALKSFQGKKVLFLRNHGVLLAMQSLEEWKDWESLEQNFWHFFFPQIQNFLKPDWVFHQSFPFRALTPDFAVFADQVKAYLNLSDNEGVWSQSLVELGAGKTSAQKKNIQNLFEIWWAHGILQSLMPSLTSLSEESISELVHLPTEQHRKSTQQKGGSDGSI